MALQSSCQICVFSQSCLLILNKKMLSHCPGLYCGRSQLENNTWSNCGACEPGFRVNESYACVACSESPSTYDWMYLGFMVILPLIMHWYFIDTVAEDNNLVYIRISKNQLILHAGALIETIAAATIALLVIEPMGSFDLTSCRVNKFSDWYTLFYNPTPDYQNKLYCTQEAVYPYQTIVLIFYFLCLVMMLLIRPILNATFLKNGKSALYSALYFLPLLTFLHTVAGGLIYYSFPYLSVVISMVSNACHYSIKLDQSMRGLLKSSLTEIKNLVVIIGHWLLLAYGIISLQQHYALLALVPFPSIFYILTVKFTDPDDFRFREERSTT